MTLSNLTNLHAVMVNIDESEPVTEDETVEESSDAQNVEWNHDLDGDDWEDKNVDAPVSDYDASMYDMKGTDEERFDADGQRIRGDHEMHEEDPWGIGDGDAGVPDDIQLNERDVREVTNKVHESMDDGMMDPRDVADAALKYMSEDDVADMARSNDWLFLFTDEDDDEGDDFALSSTDWNEE